MSDRGRWWRPRRPGALARRGVAKKGVTLRMFFQTCRGSMPGPSVVPSTESNRESARLRARMGGMMQDRAAERHVQADPDAQRPPVGFTFRKQDRGGLSDLRSVPFVRSSRSV
jgi:hypothetical protein